MTAARVVHTQKDLLGVMFLVEPLGLTGFLESLGPRPSVIQRFFTCASCQVRFSAFLQLVSPTESPVPVRCPGCGRRQEVTGSALTLSYPITCPCGKSMSAELEPSDKPTEVHCPQCARGYLLYGKVIALVDPSTGSAIVLGADN